MKYRFITRMYVMVAAAAMAGTFSARAETPSLERLLDGARALGPAIVEPALRLSETDRPAMVDYGPGPGLPKRKSAARLAASAAPNGSAVGGAFGPAVAWPVVPIHLALLPSGRVMSYGTDQRGAQGAQLVYDVWDPAAGVGPESHLALPNTTGTDIFCAGQSLLWASGTLLMTGGDQTIGVTRNYSTNKTTLFDPATNHVSDGAAMQYPRWYPSVVALPNGRMLILGGRADPNTSVLTPELFDPATGWKTLTGATSAAAFQNYYYPRAFVAPSGDVFMIHANGRGFSITPGGVGGIAKYPVIATAGANHLPTVMYAPGKLLSVRMTETEVIDITGAPKVSRTGDISQPRYYSSGTVMADGRVLVTGGSAVPNTLTGVAYNAEIWDPATGRWTLGAAAAKPRLYHSNALLLTDGTVLTGGGGAPGPVLNLNAEIYYPPYLYAADGTPAARPALLATPRDVAVGGSLTATVDADTPIERMTLLRAGSATHTSNLDQRFLDLPFTQSGNQVTATLPANANVALPGFWMLFVWRGGVPSVAQMVRVTG